MDEIAAWLRMQAEMDLARARKAGVFVGDPRDELARAESVIALLNEFESASRNRAAERADFAGWVDAGCPEDRRVFYDPDPLLVPGLERAVRLLASGYRHRAGWKGEWAA